LERFFSFFGDHTGFGATIGLKIHIFLILIFVFVYSLVKTRKLLKSVIASFSVYLVIFLSSITPIVFKKVLGIGYSDKMMSLLFWILSITLGIVLFYLQNKRMWLTLVKDSRPERMFYYFLMLLWGITLGYKETGVISEFFWPSAALMVISLVFAIFFSIVANNLADYEIDKISNPERPLFKYDFSRENYVNFGTVSLLVSVVSALIINYRALFCISVFLGCYYIYSVPPVRFKRVTFFSKLVISVNSLIIALMGYSFFLKPSDRGYYFLSEFPEKYVYFFLLLTFAANFIDLKDYEGDKAEGIKTLPVVLGLEKAKLLIAVFFSFPYFYIITLFPELKGGCYFFIALNSWLLIKKNYDEKKLFVSFLTSIIVLIHYLSKTGT
jgi:4-hydroxybenzoate polyprenyltransferase